MAMYDPEYLRLARALCDRYEVHLICDEIAVGCGRTGTFFAHEQAEIRPDLMCLSKGISGGYLPLSIVLCSDTIYEAFLDDSVARAFLHSHSYTGNPLACRAALATLDIFEQDDVVAVNRQKAAKISAALAPLADHPQVKHLRQRGMIAAFDVATDDPHFSRQLLPRRAGARSADPADRQHGLPDAAVHRQRRGNRASWAIRCQIADRSSGQVSATMHTVDLAKTGCYIAQPESAWKR